MLEDKPRHGPIRVLLRPIAPLQTPMVILRPTRKLTRWLPAAAADPGPSDTALGDWYGNRIVVDRQPLLILVSSTSLLPMLLLARNVRSLPERLGALVYARLRRLGIDPRIAAAEQQAMRPVVIRPTADRSVVGIMVDFAKAIPYQLPAPWTEDSLWAVEETLATTPCHSGHSFDQVIFPDKKAPALLSAKWLGNWLPQSGSGALPGPF